MFKKIVSFLSAGLLSLFAMGSQAAIVTGGFDVTSASLVALYSATLDAGCTQAGGQFFTCTDSAEVLSLATAVAVTDTNTNGSGMLTLQYDDATGRIVSVDSMSFFVNDMTLLITTTTLGNATAVVVQNNNSPVANDFARVKAGTAGVNGSADADQLTGSNSIFQHDAPGAENDATDFATFTDIVDSCTIGAPVCGLIPLLGIDGLRYQLTGLVSGSGSFALSLRSETSNNSNYFVDITAVSKVPVPAAVWLFGSALGLLGWARRRTA